MHAVLIIAIVVGCAVVFAVGVLSVLHDLLARFSQPLALVLECPADKERDAETDPVSTVWGAKDASL